MAKVIKSDELKTNKLFVDSIYPLNKDNVEVIIKILYLPFNSSLEL